MIRPLKSVPAVTAPRRQRGSTIVTVMVLTLLGLVAALYAATSSRLELQIAYNDQVAQQALDVAVAGFNHAAKLIAARGVLNDELAANSAGACIGNGVGNATSGISGIGSAATLNGNCYRYNAWGPIAGGGYYVNVTDNHDETAGVDDPLHDTDGVIRITSYGVIGTATTSVTGTLTISQNWGFYGINYVTLSGGSVIDSYTGTYPGGASSQSMVGSNGNITMSGGSTKIKGSAYAGGAVSTSGGASVTGTSQSGSSPVTFPPMANCSPYGPSTGISPGTAYNSGTGALNMSGGGTITLTPGTYCFSSVTLSGGSTLSISGATVINVTGTWDSSGGSVSNTTTNSSNLKVNSSGATVKLSGSSGAYMQVYAPSANVDLSGGSSFFGGITGLSITNSGGTQMHDDLGGGGGSAVISNWHEIQG